MEYLIRLISYPDAIGCLCGFPYYTVRAVMIVLSVLPMFPVCILLSKYIIKDGPIIDGAING